MFFTRIPVKWSFFSDEPPNLTKATWSFPLIGYFIGFFSGIWGDFCLFLGLPVFLSCIVAIGMSVILTGAFHEDGLADMSDGFGAGGSPERINEIMHDSLLGTYGVISLILGILFRVALTIGLVDQGYSLFFVLGAGFATGKLAIIITRNFFKSSEFAKIGSIINHISINNYIFAILIWLLPIIIFFPFWSIILGVIFVLILIFIFGKRYIVITNGLTGDILGAVSFLSELFFLFGVLIVVGILN